MTGRQCATVIGGAWVWIAGVMVAVTWPTLQDWGELTLTAGILSTIFLITIWWRIGRSKEA